MPTTSVDTALVRAAAARIDTAADLLQEAVDTHLRALSFDGSAAGSAHAAEGDAVRAALLTIVTDAVRWARAARELSRALRAGADVHAGAETQAAGRLK